MIIEVTGCSGAGKSTLVREIVRHARERNLPVTTAPEMVAWLPGHPTLQNLALDLRALCRRVRERGRDRAFLAFARQVIRREADGVTTGLNAYRGLLRALGVHAALARRPRTVVVDEGTINVAHNVLAHVRRAPRPEDVRRFVVLVPKPDLVVHVTAPLAVVLRRTATRPDPPLRHRSRADNERYVRHAHALFGALLADERLVPRTVPVFSEDDHRDQYSIHARAIVDRLL